MKIYLGTDHAGFYLKEKVKLFLQNKGYDTEDCGAFQFDKDDDYPDFIAKTAEEVSKNFKNSMGIIFGGSGQGEAITANKFKNIRCAVFFGNDMSMVRFFREHNNANILSIGVRFTDEDKSLEAINIFLNTAFSNEERHVRRIEKIRHIEEDQSAKIKNQRQV